MYRLNLGCCCCTVSSFWTSLCLWDSNNPDFLGLFRDLLYVFTVMYKNDQCVQCGTFILFRKSVYKIVPTCLVLVSPSF